MLKVRSYNNKGIAPNFIHEIEQLSQHAVLIEKNFFLGVCYTCGVLATEKVCLQRCAGCQLVSYCSKKCQKTNWKLHKVLCKKFPMENGKNIMVRKTESVGKDKKMKALLELAIDCKKMADEIDPHQKDEAPPVINDWKDEWDQRALWMDEWDQLAFGMYNFVLNARMCPVCDEARPEMLFDCSCCAVSYCSQEHRIQDYQHWNQNCDLLYSCAMGNWYLTQHLQLQIPEGLLNEANLDCGLKFKKVSKLVKYSSEKWLETIVNLTNELLSFPLTIHHALKDLKLGEQSKSIYELSTLNIHIVHDYPMLDPRIWEFFLHQLPNIEILNLTFLSENMKLDNRYNACLPVERCSDCKRKKRVINYNIQPMHYHEYFSSDDYVQPDVVVSFGTDHETNYTPDFYKAHAFTSCMNMTYFKNTVVIITKFHELFLVADLKKFQDARPINVLLPIQNNPFYGFSMFRGNYGIIYGNNFLCCIQRKY